jgi:hypothetical protein
MQMQLSGAAASAVTLDLAAAAAPQLICVSLDLTIAMESSHKHEAERLRIGVAGGWVPIAAAVAWADRIILEDPSPDAAIIDVALAGKQSRSEVAALLALIEGETDAIAARKQALADLLGWIGQDVEKGASAAHYLHELACSGLIPEEYFGWEPYALEDSYDLAREGISGTVKDALEQVRGYLARVTLP